MAMEQGPVASKGYNVYRVLCKVQVRSLGISSIQGVVKPIGSDVWVSCLLPFRCTSVELDFKGLEKAL